ncbi:hypothetical protein DDB_G0274143 [Dictyostelium discoideum AX4]|uniref:MJ1316 RNA cyclic group end recognition domain-containing protein n=1 Tax=Dictyostelium discoideum TaxID=44689 RepID=Q86KE6_DICDI|nr:hypothetical protein DDB_G0274143 [Dictyostelium discoideum AX4]EAL69964.1 hypothetical protein DDB_G0274143 [Dictyostelium discoideum AX4]|eukprot:XP_644317.1 hypothetical protein DDB_G0274143 [Dictyostelium discoideum AX4]
MSTTIYFSYPTYSNEREFTTYDDDSEEEYYDQSYFQDYSFQNKPQPSSSNINKSKSVKVTGYGNGSKNAGQAIPRTDKDYKAAIEYKKEKKLAIKQIKENKLSTSPTTITTTTTTNTATSYENVNIESPNDENNKTKKLTKLEVKSIIEKETDLKKKERLPSSIEVYNRILHDEQLKDKIQDFIITYEDRFDGLCDSELLKLDEAIPFHRIRQIRYLNQIVWSRSERFYDFSNLLD